jgi:MFS family permease
MDSLPDRPPRPALYTRQFVVLICLQLAYGFSFSTFFLLPKFLAVALHAGPSAIGVVTSMFGLSGLLAVPLLTASIDRVERRMFVRVGAVLMVLAALGFLSVRQPDAWASGLRFLQGISWAMVFTTSLALVGDTSPPQRMAEALGVLGSASLVMNAIAPALVEPIADRFGYAFVFLLAALSAVVATVLSFLVDEPPAAASTARAVRTSVGELLSRPSTALMALVVGTAGAAFAVMFTFHQPFALEVGIHRVRGFFLAYTAGALTVRFGLPKIADRLGRHPVAVAALGLYGASVIGMQHLTATSLVVYGGLFGVAHGFFFPAFNAMLLESAMPDERGRLMVLSNGFFSIGNAAVLGLGFMVAHAGYPAVFRAVGGATLMAMVLLFASPRIIVRAAARHTH